MLTRYIDTMSCTELYGVENSGAIIRVGELPNGRLHAALAWSSLGDKYLGAFVFGVEYAEYTEAREAARLSGRDPDLDPDLKEFDHGGWRRSWKLRTSPKITEADWLVLMSTFDGCIILRDHFQHTIRCFREFHAQFPRSHFGACAEVVQTLLTEDYRGYCVNCTSVNRNPWWIQPRGEERHRLEEAGDPDFEGRPYNIDRDTHQMNGTPHWFLNPADYATRTAQV